MLDPREVTKKFRSQELIDELIASTEAFLVGKTLEQLTMSECADVALAYSEVGDFEKATVYSDRIILHNLDFHENNTKNEPLATAGYVRAVVQRVHNQYSEASRLFDLALNLAASDWLKSNIERNDGLVYLNLKEYEKAAAHFENGYRIAVLSKDLTLKGTWPALANYCGLAWSRSALKLKGEMQPADSVDEGLTSAHAFFIGSRLDLGKAWFNQAALHYQQMFKIKNINEEQRLGLHDYVSHCFHLGIILCETNEQLQEGHNLGELESALSQFETVLAARSQNKADHVRIGDVHQWIGRTYLLCGQNFDSNKLQDAKNAFEAALKSYRQAGLVDGDDSHQIQDVLKLLVKTRLVSQADVSVFESNVKQTEDPSSVATNTAKIG